jgi:hypothetical protein
MVSFFSAGALVWREPTFPEMENPKITMLRPVRIFNPQARISKVNADFDGDCARRHIVRAAER